MRSPLRRNNGHRKAAEDAHRRAIDLASAQETANLAVAAQRAAREIPAESPSVSEIPDLIEPIIGWRCWNVWLDGHLLALNGGTSYGGQKWEPREAKRSVCNQGQDMYLDSRPKRTHTHGPHDGCRCGYYAAKLLAKAQWPEANYAYGRVAMWGKVIEHEGGFRAEYAYPIEVVLVPKTGFRPFQGTYSVHSPIPPPTEIPAWTEDQLEGIRLRMATMYGCPVSVGSDEAMRDEWAAQYLDIPLPPQVVPLLEARV